MSNDRLWLYCRGCNGRLLLWKHWPSGAGGTPNNLEDGLGEFIAEHLEDQGLRFASSLGSPAPFVVHTEASETEAGLDPQ